VSSRYRVLGRLLRSLRPHWQAVAASALALGVADISQTGEGSRDDQQREN
jgi:hypothetical protein